MLFCHFTPPSTQEPTPSAGPLERYASLPYGNAALSVKVALRGNHLLAAGEPVYAGEGE